ncbi:MAG TPA: hypothetical protein VGF77_09450 [Allosphingosinicella sp.]|jgi:hypothetical protein
MGPKGDTIGDVDRRAERLAVDEITRLRPNDWSSIEIRMIDLSALGFRADCEAHLRVGSGVMIDIEGIGPVQAQVEWQHGGQFGGSFLMPIDLGRCVWGRESPNPA